MISLFEALKLVTGAVEPLTSTEIAIEDAAGHVAAEDITSPTEVPSFRSATMDGFAIASDQINSLPTTLKIDRTVFAGSQMPDRLDRTKAMKVMTGAPVPEPYDTVVPFEDTHFDESSVTIEAKVAPLKYIRLPGSDVRKDEVLLRKGDLISPITPGVLASVGLAHIPVVRKARISILSTGDELVAPGQSLRPGQVHDSNSFTVEAMTRLFRASVETKRSVVDDVDTIKHELDSACDVIITSGGVSAGERDYVPSVAKESGWKALLHGVAIKPGKPVFVATKKNQILFGLPGNPLSAAVICALFVLPALKKLMGSKSYIPVLSDATLGKSPPIQSKRTIVWPGMFTHDGKKLVVTLSDKRLSSSISALLGSDGLVFLIRNGNDSTPVVKAAWWREILNL